MNGRYIVAMHIFSSSFQIYYDTGIGLSLIIPGGSEHSFRAYSGGQLSGYQGDRRNFKVFPILDLHFLSAPGPADFIFRTYGSVLMMKKKNIFNVYMMHLQVIISGSGTHARTRIRVNF